MRIIFLILLNFLISQKSVGFTTGVSNGQIIKKRLLSPWVIAPGSELDYDPVVDQLLLTLLNDSSNLSLTYSGRSILSKTIFSKKPSL